MSLGGALGGPVTAFQYDWNMLPIGQQLWVQGTAVVQEVPAAAGSGDLQPQWHHATKSRRPISSRRATSYVRNSI